MAPNISRLLTQVRQSGQQFRKAFKRHYRSYQKRTLPTSSKLTTWSTGNPVSSLMTIEDSHAIQPFQPLSSFGPSHNRNCPADGQQCDRRDDRERGHAVDAPDLQNMGF